MTLRGGSKKKKILNDQSLQAENGRSARITETKCAHYHWRANSLFLKIGRVWGLEARFRNPRQCHISEVFIK